MFLSASLSNISTSLPIFSLSKDMICELAKDYTREMIVREAKPVLFVGRTVTWWCRWYSSNNRYGGKVDFKKLKPMILKRIEEREKEYPIKAMIPVADAVLNARARLFEGVSTLIQLVPVLSCKYCSEIYVGSQGHKIRNCAGYRRIHKNQVHEWINGKLPDFLPPVETFHLSRMFQDVIKHHQRFDYDRVPAVIELCWQAGANPNLTNWDLNNFNIDVIDAESLSKENIKFIASNTLRAWETLRLGVQKLLMAYPCKVCKYCSEVHVGPSGHKARLCGVFKFESWRGGHFWKKATVDDLVPPKVVWARRPQDPMVLVDNRRDFYGHAPAVVDLCVKAGAIVPVKYNCMMKIQGLSTHLV